MHEILECLCLFMLIMIDVKLTLSGLWWTTYLFVWMGRRRAGLVLLLDWWVLEDSGATPSICFWCLNLGLWSRMSVFMIILDWFCWIYVVEILPIGRDLEILYDDVYWSHGMYNLEMYNLYALRLLRNFIYACWYYLLKTCFMCTIFLYSINQTLFL